MLQLWYRPKKPAVGADDEPDEVDIVDEAIEAHVIDEADEAEVADENDVVDEAEAADFLAEIFIFDWLLLSIIVYSSTEELPSIVGMPCKCYNTACCIPTPWIHCLSTSGERESSSCDEPHKN